MAKTKSSEDAGLGANDAEEMVKSYDNPSQLGELLFSAEEIKLILLSEPETFELQVKQGQLLTESAVRKVVVEQAKAGSSEAQKLVQKWLDKLRIEELRNR